MFLGLDVRRNLIVVGVLRFGEMLLDVSMIVFVQVSFGCLVATSLVRRHSLLPAKERVSDGRLEPKGRREIFCGGSWSKAEIYLADELFVGASIAGLAVVEASDTTIVVGQNQRATVDALGSLVIESDI